MKRYHEYTRYATPDRLARHAMDGRGGERGGASGIDDDDDTDDDHIDPDYTLLGQQLGKEFDDLYIGMVSMTTACFFPGVLDILKRIASSASSTTISNNNSNNSMKLGALTNASVEYAHAVFRVNLDSNKDDDKTHQINFLSIHGADTAPRPKPHADGLLLVCKELNVNPNQAVYVGDSPSDAVAANAAGMTSIGVTWGSHSRPSLEMAPFDIMCDTIDELAEALGL
jgi:phosphoglycolate phosphatase-like HAD superfamily hydrolase